MGIDPALNMNAPFDVSSSPRSNGTRVNPPSQTLKTAKQIITLWSVINRRHCNLANKKKGWGRIDVKGHTVDKLGSESQRSQSSVLKPRLSSTEMRREERVLLEDVFSQRPSDMNVIWGNKMKNYFLRMKMIFLENFVLEGVFPHNKPKHWSIPELQNLLSRKDQNPIHGRSFVIPNILTPLLDRVIMSGGRKSRTEISKISDRYYFRMKPYFTAHFHPASTGGR